jgi:hypothetical protein
MIAAYRHSDRGQGRHLMNSLIASLSGGVPAELSEVITLGRTLNERAADVLAYFDRPAHPTARLRRSTAASSTSAAPLSGSATSPTTSPDHYSKAEGSDPDYTLNCEEPGITTVLSSSNMNVAATTTPSVHHLRLITSRRISTTRNRGMS